MSGQALSEQRIEDAAIEHLESLGALAFTGALLRDNNELGAGSILTQRAIAAVQSLNPELLESDVASMVASLSRPPHPTLIENNRWFHSLLVDGVPVEHRDAQSGEMRGIHARLIDFEKPLANEFLVARQLTIEGESGARMRADLVLYVNGLPLVVIELKDPADVKADLNVAIDQLVRYRESAPDAFVSNAVLVASDGLLTRVGSITSGRQRFMRWRASSVAFRSGKERSFAERKATLEGATTLEACIEELLAPAAFLDFLRSCVVFEQDERGNIVKKVAGYHQFRAVKKARASVLSALKPPAGVNRDEDAGKGGVVWHTQGSGKSLTMLMLAGALVREPAMANPTLVVVTDRNDLDNQLADTFAMGRLLLRQDPVQAESRAHLKRLLDKASGGVIFTTIHKFTEDQSEISKRANIVVMADEAHRSQYGFIDGGAKWMRDALKNATFVGFTGTPIDKADRSTRRTFGDYVDIYDIRQAVEDQATVPIYYEPRIIKLTIDQKAAEEAEKEIAALAKAQKQGEDAPEDIRIPLEALIGAPERVARLAAFIVEHWEGRRSAMEGKAMVVTASRDIAARLYEEIKTLRPAWHDADESRGAMKVVVTGSADDPQPLRNHVRTKADRERLAKRFKNPTDDFRLAIVCDMWLTGFDVPAAHTMYLDKPLAGHNLMQAIARVNRVYGDKPGGLVVDLLGLADQVADALATYANATGESEKPIRQVQDEAVPAMQTAFERLQDFFDGLNYSAALRADPKGALQVYLAAVNHVYAQDDGWNRFRKHVKELAAAFALAVPRPETEVVAPHLGFFQHVVAMIRKRLSDEKPPTPGGAGQTDVDIAVRQVLGGAVEAGAVLDLFEIAGLDAGRLDILSQEFLSRVAALEQKNLALETLRKLLNDQIRLIERKNIVMSRRFREALEQAMLRYTNKQISTAEMIAQLMDLANWVREAKEHGQKLGLSDEETAFYDALTEKGSAKEVMKSDTLRLMARELSEMVKKMPKLDWTLRESVRADLRRKVRRLLALYGYPPDLSEDATQLVLKQAEHSTGNAEE